MRKLKKWIALALTAGMALSVFAGCSGGTASSGAASEAASEAASAASETASGTESTSGEGGNDALKIAIVSSPSGVDDGSFNQDVYTGILNFIEEHPDSSVTPVKEPTGDTAAAVQAVTDIVADYDVLVCSGYQFAGIGTLAQENPDKDFILIDSYPTDADGATVEVDNIYAMTFAEQEGGFFAGIAAAMETKSNKVAVVNGVAYPSNINYQYGFECGVKYVNETQGKSVECVELPSQAGTDASGNNIGGNYIGSFSDQATGKTVGDQLISQGCDIIFVAAGDSGNGVFTAAKESNGACMVIGCDADQYDFGENGDSNIILTSAIKNLHLATQRALDTIADGTFKGQNVLLHADTDSTGYVSEEGRQQLSQETLDVLADAYEQVKDGTIVPASASEGTPDTFTVNG